MIRRADGRAAAGADEAAGVTVTLPAALRALFPGCPPQLRLAAATVADAMEGLDAAWPGMRGRLCDETPAVRRHVRCFVDGERADLATRLRPGAEVLVMTAISGG